MNKLKGEIVDMNKKIKNKTKTAIIIAFALISICSAAYASGKFYFYSADRENAEFDLDAKVPKDALYTRSFEETPFFDVLYYQFDNNDGMDFFCHFLYADMGYGIKRSGVDYKVRLPDGKLVVFGRKYDSDEIFLAPDHFEYKNGSPQRYWRPKFTPDSY